MGPQYCLAHPRPADGVHLLGSPFASPEVLDRDVTDFEENVHAANRAVLAEGLKQRMMGEDVIRRPDELAQFPAEPFHSLRPDHRLYRHAPQRLHRQGRDGPVDPR